MNKELPGWQSVPFVSVQWTQEDFALQWDLDVQINHVSGGAFIALRLFGV